MTSRIVACLACAAVLAQAACLQLGTGTDAGVSADGGVAASASATGASASPSAGGTGCTEDPQTQVTLCQSIDVCPGVVVDESVFAGCGFRLHASATLDLECLCGTLLCPVGVPDSCAQAAQLLASESVLTVCENASQGGCVEFASPDAGAGTAASSCDKSCEASCAGEPDCLQLCGC